MFTKYSMSRSGFERMSARLLYRRGGIGMMLIMVMVIALVLLPLSVTLIRQFHSWLLICQAEQLIEETMNSCLLLTDSGSLSDGQFKFSLYQLQQHMETQLDEQMPEALAAHFQFERIEMIMQPPQSDEMLWHVSRDFLSWPVLTCHASVTDYRGRTIPVRRSVICRFGRSVEDPGLNQS